MCDLVDNLTWYLVLKTVENKQHKGMVQVNCMYTSASVIFISHKLYSIGNLSTLFCLIILFLGYYFKSLILLFPLLLKIECLLRHVLFHIWELWCNIYYLVRFTAYEASLSNQLVRNTCTLYQEINFQCKELRLYIFYLSGFR